MQDQKKPPSIIIAKTLLSFFGVGFIKFAPGTWGSLASLPLLYWLSLNNFSSFVLTLILIGLLALSSWLADLVQKYDKSHDPGWIVLDEVLGMLTVICLYPMNSVRELIFTFALFRFFDILKLWPVNLADENIRNGFGTMLDDILAGIQTSVILWLINIVSLI